MLKDFVKIETFLTVVRERSFSKASARLGISQPAVTQQIKFIENYLDSKIIERKKNGIRLTASGEELYKVSIKLEKCLHSTESDLLNIIGKKITFRLGASFTIGSYVVPGDCLNNMSEVIHNDVKLNVEKSDIIVKKILNKQLELGLIEANITNENMISREWKEDELVIFSSVPLPKFLNPEDLYGFKWICRERDSHTRRIMSDVFEEIGVNCSEFDVISEVSDTTTVLQTVMKSAKDAEHPVVSVISKYAIADKVAKGELYEARLNGYKMYRNFFIVYHKDNKHNAYVNNAVDHILSGKC